MFNWLKRQFIGSSRQRTSIHKRRNTKLDNQLMAKVGSAGWPAQVTDLSAKKVRIIVGRWQQCGSSLALILVNRKTGISYSVQSRIVQVVLRNDGLWNMCCAFTQPLNMDEWEALLQK